MDNYIVNKSVADEMGIDAALFYQYIKERFIEDAIEEISAVPQKWVNVKDYEILNKFQCFAAEDVTRIKRYLARQNYVGHKLQHDKYGVASSWYCIL